MAIKVGEGRVEPLAQAEPKGGGDAFQVELHQKRVAIKADKAEVYGLRKPK